MRVVWEEIGRSEPGVPSVVSAVPVAAAVAVAVMVGGVDVEAIEGEIEKVEEMEGEMVIEEMEGEKEEKEETEETEAERELVMFSETENVVVFRAETVLVVMFTLAVTVVDAAADAANAARTKTPIATVVRLSISCSLFKYHSKNDLSFLFGSLLHYSLIPRVFRGPNSNVHNQNLEYPLMSCGRSDDLLSFRLVGLLLIGSRLSTSSPLLLSSTPQFALLLLLIVLRHTGIVHLCTHVSAYSYPSLSCIVYCITASRSQVSSFPHLCSLSSSVPVSVSASSPHPYFSCSKHTPCPSSCFLHVQSENPRPRGPMQASCIIPRFCRRVVVTQTCIS